jgi:hypothetical protein
LIILHQRRQKLVQKKLRQDLLLVRSQHHYSLTQAETLTRPYESTLSRSTPLAHEHDVTCARFSTSNDVADEIDRLFRELSRYIEGHSHSEAFLGAEPDISTLETLIREVDAVAKASKVERQKTKAPAREKGTTS